MADIAHWELKLAEENPQWIAWYVWNSQEIVIIFTKVVSRSCKKDKTT